MTRNEVVLGSIQDHIMANTWRLIFEYRSGRSPVSNTPKPAPDFSRLAEVLPEYRLIGLHLAGNSQRRYQ